MTAEEITALRYKAHTTLAVMTTVLTYEQLKSNEVKAVEDLVVDLLNIIQRESE